MSLELFTGKRALSVLSGGMDSTIATVIASRLYGSENAHAISFYYRQKQSYELELAKQTCKDLGIKHTLVDISFLGDVVSGVSSNIIGSDVEMPTITEILGDPQPVTYIPNRNSILLNIAASYAEVNELDTVITGLQSQDTFGYWDTTQSFVDAVNEVWSQNRMSTIQLIAPFMKMNKTYEIENLVECVGLETALDVLSKTRTCYDLDENHISCGVCPSCAERIQAFKQAGIIDPIEYKIKVNW